MHKCGKPTSLIGYVAEVEYLNELGHTKQKIIFTFGLETCKVSWF